MSTIREVVRIGTTPEHLTIEWADGAVAEFPGVWLRDNLPEDRDPHSGQRLVDIADLPARPLIRSASVAGDTVRIEWESETPSATFAVAWLAAQAARDAMERPERITTSWLRGAEMDAAHDFAWASLAELRSDSAAKLRWLTRLLQTGVAFLSAVPSTERAILDAMVQPVLLFSASGTSPTQQYAASIGDFVYVDGAFRFVDPQVFLALSTAPPARIRVSGDAALKSLDHKVAPSYPDEERANRVQGTVVLHVVIGTDGSIKDIEAVSGDPALVKAATVAVQQWKYKPTLLNAEPVEVDTIVKLDFRL